MTEKHSMYRPYLRPINQAEALLEPFYAHDPAADGSLLPILDAYEVTWQEAAEGTLSAPARIDVRRADPQSWAVRLRCRCEVAIDAYDRMRFSVSLPVGMWFELEAEIDGRSVVIFEQTFGTDGSAIHVAPLGGRRLTAYSITAGVSGGHGRLIGDLQWLSLADSVSLDRLESKLPVFPDDWPGLLRPIEESLPSAPQLGLFFDADGLGALRRLLRTPPYEGAYESLRQSAEQKMAEWVPERLVTPGRPRAWMAVGVCDLLAFVGLVDDNKPMSRLAARTALAAAHCGDWSRDNSVREPMPGILARDRCFGESFYLRALPLVLDWAGHMLTPYGREVIRDAMIRNGIGPVESVFMSWEYIRSMNQGIMFGIGRILAYIALQQKYPRYHAALDQAQADMAEMLDNYIMEDGGTREGMGYWHVVADVLPLYFALAKQKNASLADVAPPRLLKAGAFALGMRSIRGDGLTWLPVNQVHHDNMITARVAAAFTALTPDSEWPDVYRRVSACGHGMGDLFHLLLAPAAMRVTGQRATIAGTGRGPAAPTAELLAFPAVGQASMHIHEPRLGRIHLHVCSGPSKGGHSHQDKGSFILEVGDEVLALDRGTTSYDNPAHLLMWRAECHNLVCPGNEDGIFLEQAPRETAGGRILEAASSRPHPATAGSVFAATTPGLGRRVCFRATSAGSRIWATARSRSMMTSKCRLPGGCFSSYTRIGRLSRRIRAGVSRRRHPRF